MKNYVVDARVEEYIFWSRTTIATRPSQASRGDPSQGAPAPSQTSLGATSQVEPSQASQGANSQAPYVVPSQASQLSQRWNTERKRKRRCIERMERGRTQRESGNSQTYHG